MTKLVIVESPSKAKKIQSYLDDGWIVKASMGHIRDLPQKDMGVDLETFKPVYVSDSRGAKTTSMLKKLCRAASEVFLATDPDREGEAIAWHLVEALNLKNPVRVMFNSITKKTVLQAISSPGSIDYKLVRAQEGRRVLDRLVGYSVSPALSNAYGEWLTAGRVQSVAVRIVAEREIEIQAFKPVSYVEVFLIFNTDEIYWRAQWIPGALLPEGETRWMNKTFAERVFAEHVSNITDVCVVESITQKKSRRAPPPFTTASLQQGASVTLKISPEECMQNAQKLYENGLITYHRTDSPNLSDEGVADVMNWLNNNGYSEHVATKTNTWKAKQGAQAGHEAIRPTAIVQLPDTAKSQLTIEQYQLYALIWNRTVACQMKDAQFNATTIRLKSVDKLNIFDDKYMDFLAKGQQLLYSGWMMFTSQDATDESIKEKDPVLPVLQDNQYLITVDGEVVDKKTKPPSRYTEASLVKKMETEGIGRPSTYASIIKNIKQRGYVSAVKRNLHAEEIGMVIYKSLINKFQFMELKYTREIEKQLDDIALGENDYFNVVSQAYGLLKNELKSLEGVKIHNKDQHLCPKCNNPLRLIKKKFWGCSNYNKDGNGCGYTAENEKNKPGKPKVEKTIDITYPCACDQGYMQRRPCNGSAFWGCSSFPSCRNTLPDADGKPGEKKSGVNHSDKNNASTGKACPSCNNGVLIERIVKKAGKNQGKKFYACSNKNVNKIKCDYFDWLIK